MLLSLVAVTWAYFAVLAGPPVAAQANGFAFEPEEPLSLEELLDQAVAVFEGTVASIHHANSVETINGIPVTFPVRHVNFLLVNGISREGVFRPGATYSIRQYEPLAAPAKKTEHVLWFVAGPTPIRFQNPVGMESGRFQLKPDAAHVGYFVAENGHRNRSLWRHDGPLWNPETFPVERARSFLHSKLGLPEGRVQAVLAAGSVSNKGKPVPAELLVAAAYAYWR